MKWFEASHLPQELCLVVWLLEHLMHWSCEHLYSPWKTLVQAHIYIYIYTYLSYIYIYKYKYWKSNIFNRFQSNFNHKELHGGDEDDDEQGPAADEDQLRRNYEEILGAMMKAPWKFVGFLDFKISVVVNQPTVFCLCTMNSDCVPEIGQVTSGNQVSLLTHLA